MAGGYFRISNDNTITDENDDINFRSPVAKIEFVMTGLGMESIESFPKAVLLDGDFPLDSFDGTALFNGKKAKTVTPVFLECAGLDASDYMLHYTGHVGIFAPPTRVGVNAEIDLAIGDKSFVARQGKNTLYIKNISISGTTA